ncbi:MAG: pyridoxamine 5'-phosphate oxidase family protein [Ferruginibacter sp.]
MQMKFDEEHIRFLKEKIDTLKFAIFKSDMYSALHLPNNIIQVLKVENDGSIWFLTSCNGKHSKAIDSSFYAYLDFYKKGTGCRLQLSGKATIAEDDDEVYLTMSDYSKGVASSGRLVLVKMKIMQAEYFENKTEPVGSITDKFKFYFHQLFLSNPHRTYNFS